MSIVFSGSENDEPHVVTGAHFPIWQPPIGAILFQECLTLKNHIDYIIKLPTVSSCVVQSNDYWQFHLMLSEVDPPIFAN